VLVHNGRRWIPAFAGSEWGIRIACDPPTQRSSHAGDDGGNFMVASKTTVVPAQAGIQSRSLCTR